MASLRSFKVALPTPFKIILCPGWTLDIHTDMQPTIYTLTHGKKSMTFQSNITQDLISRNYSLRLGSGRREMVLPPEVLASFVEHETFLTWYDPSLVPNQTSQETNDVIMS